jgi:glycosyltransferase involved in cell wall biosynthesis
MAERRLRIGIDATPLAGHRTGIGRYVEQLISALAIEAGLELHAGAFTIRGRDALSHLPAGVRAVHRPIPARLLHRAWLRGDVPAAEWVLGSVDVVHGTNFVLPPARRAAGVVTVHDLSFVRFPELVNRASLDYQSLVPRAVARAAVVLTPTESVADELSEQYGVDRSRVMATPLGVEPAWFGPAPAPIGLRRSGTAGITGGGIGPGGVAPEYLLAVGTLEPRKGLDVLLTAYRYLVAAEPDVPPLVLVGPPGWGPALSTSGIDPARVVLPGYLDTDELRSLVAHARLLAFPSRYEGFGLPPLEALAAGTPVIAADVPAVREVVGSVSAMVDLVPVADAEALAEALRRRLANPPSPQDVATGRDHARAFSWQRCAALTASAYRLAAG